MHIARRRHGRDRNAAGIFEAARHRRARVADTATTCSPGSKTRAMPRVSRRMGLAQRAVGRPPPNRGAGGEVIVAETREGRFTQTIAARAHALRADERIGRRPGVRAGAQRPAAGRLGASPDDDPGVRGPQKLPLDRVTVRSGTRRTTRPIVRVRNARREDRPDRARPSNSKARSTSRPRAKLSRSPANARDRTLHSESRSRRTLAGLNQPDEEE